MLLAKLWSVYPKLFGRPLVRSLPHALERVSILVLSGAAFFELVTGLFNVAQNYPWAFYFPAAHYAVAWVAIGLDPRAHRGEAAGDPARRCTG